jgi:hypothetical protein
LPSGQNTGDVTLCVGSERIARDDHDLAGQLAGDLVYIAPELG